MEWNKACLPCRLVHTTCDGKRPCRRCVKLGKPSTCVNVEKKRRGRPPKNRAAVTTGGAVGATVAGHKKNESEGGWKNEVTERAMRPRKQPAHYEATEYGHGARRSSRRRRFSTRKSVDTRSPSSSSAEDDDDEEEDDSEEEEEDDEDYDDYRGAGGKKRKTPTHTPAPTHIAQPEAAPAETQHSAKRPRTEPQELQPPAPYAGGPASPEMPNVGCADDQLPILLDPVYSWIADLDPIGSLASADSGTFLAFPIAASDIPLGVAASASLPFLSSPLPSMTAQQPHCSSALTPTGASSDDRYPALLPSFEFRDGLDHDHDGFDAEDGHEDDHDHDSSYDCTCSSPHSNSSSTLSSFSSGADAADAQLVNGLFGMMTDQVGELKKANEGLRDSIDTLWQTFSERLDREETRINQLSQVISTRLTPSDACAQESFASSPVALRPELFRELPFLLDWANDIDFTTPDGFVIDDMSKPFIVRRLFEPTQDMTQSLPVSTYASPAFCHFTRTAPHEIMGTLCYKAQEEPLRWFLAKKCPRPVGELCFLPLVRQIDDRTVQCLTRNQLFYDRDGIARWWILVVEKFVSFTEPAMMSSAAATRPTWPQAQQDRTSSDGGDHLPSKAEPSAA